MFPPEWHLVNQESGLICSCIFNGLNDLRRANIHDKGSFYGVFFNLTIGIERLLKLTLIIDYMQANQLQCPTSNYVRSHGHDLTSLLVACQQRADVLHIPCDLTFMHSTIKQDILRHLNDYSNGLRYHNLDSLQGKAKGRDPLKSWDSIINSIYKEEVPKRKKVRVEVEAKFVSDLLRNCSSVLHHGLDQNPLDIDSYTLVPSKIATVVPYATLHIIEIINEINRVHFAVADLTHQECHRLGRNNPVVPFVEEGYTIFGMDRSYLLKKKKWP